MADDDRSPEPALEAGGLGLAQPVAASFYQLLRRIECTHRELPRLGRAAAPGAEPVRLAQDPSLSFQAASVVAVSQEQAGRPPRVRVGFFGAFGPNGPLPLHLSEFAQQRQDSYRDATFARFVDIFHHRLLSLFYRAWADAQPVVSRDRPGQDAIAAYVAALAGQSLGEATPLRRQTDRHSLYFAPHLLTQARHPKGLESLLSSFFNVQVRVEEFVHEWMPIPEPYRWRLQSSSVHSAAITGTLGHDTRVGSEVPERQFKFRIALGPLDHASFPGFLPTGAQFAELVQLVRRYIGPELAWDVRLIPDSTAMEPLVLGRTGRIGESTFLGGADARAPSGWQEIVVEPA